MFAQNAEVGTSTWYLLSVQVMSPDNSLCSRDIDEAHRYRIPFVLSTQRCFIYVSVISPSS